MSIFNIINVSASGMSAERLRMDLIAENMANVNTLEGKDGKPYKRKMAIFQERREKQFRVPMNITYDNNINIGNGVRVLKVVEDNSPFKYVYDPGNPKADKNGYVLLPNVNTVREMTDMITATRAYEANATVIKNAKQMATQAINIGR